MWVAEVTAERDDEGEPEIPWHLTPEPGAIALQLRTTIRRVAMGAGLARRAELVDAVRALPGVPSVVTSPAGGTFVIGGPRWMGLCAIGTPVDGQTVMPLDWMVASLRAWFEVALAPFGVTSLDVGKVAGGWCPGFSDLGVGGRKLIGLGFRATREYVVMRGVMPVAPIDSDDMSLLQAIHRLIDVDVHPPANTSVADLAGEPDLTVGEVIGRIRGAAVGAGAP